jgi:hypothetical protein
LNDLLDPFVELSDANPMLLRVWDLVDETPNLIETLDLPLCIQIKREAGQVMVVLPALVWLGEQSLVLRIGSIVGLLLLSARDATNAVCVVCESKCLKPVTLFFGEEDERSSTVNTRLQHIVIHVNRYCRPMLLGGVGRNGGVGYDLIARILPTSTEKILPVVLASESWQLPIPGVIRQIVG